MKGEVDEGECAVWLMVEARFSLTVMCGRCDKVNWLYCWFALVVVAVCVMFCGGLPGGTQEEEACTAHCCWRGRPLACGQGQAWHRFAGF